MAVALACSHGHMSFHCRISDFYDGNATHRAAMAFQILVSAGASNVMLVTLLMPFSALFLGNAFLDEPIRTQEIAGALIIGLGLIFIDGRVLRVIQRIRYNL